MMVAPSLAWKVMSWPSMVGSLAATDSGLCAAGDGDAAGEAAGDAATAGDAAGAVVGLGGVVGAVVGCAAGCGAQPSASSKVAAEATPPVMLRTRRTRSRRDRWPSL